MLVIPLVLFGCQILICSPSHMSIICFAPAVSALQFLRSEILSLWHLECVPAMMPSAIISSRPSNHLVPSSCASDSADHCAHIQIIFTYLLTYNFKPSLILNSPNMELNSLIIFPLVTRLLWRRRSNAIKVEGCCRDPLTIESNCCRTT